jgi:hypothetical protein
MIYSGVGQGESNVTVGTCPACGRAHATGAETCSYCGEPLTGVARVLTASTARRQPRWLEQNRQRASELRRSEDHASAERMETFVETDRRRQAAEQAVAVETEARERRAMLLAGLVFALVAALAAGVVLALVL